VPAERLLPRRAARRSVVVDVKVAGRRSANLRRPLAHRHPWRTARRFSAYGVTDSACVRSRSIVASSNTSQARSDRKELGVENLVRRVGCTRRRVGRRSSPPRRPRDTGGTVHASELRISPARRVLRETPGSSRTGRRVVLESRSVRRDRPSAVDRQTRSRMTACPRIDSGTSARDARALLPLVVERDTDQRSV